MSDEKFKFPTEIIELPSKGLLYPEGHPLADGKIEMKYMTAKEEDILTNQSYIQKGTVIDKLLEALIVSKIDYRDLIIGDKNALLIAVRILEPPPSVKIPGLTTPPNIKILISLTFDSDIKLETPGEVFSRYSLIAFSADARVIPAIYNLPMSGIRMVPSL